MSKAKDHYLELVQQYPLRRLSSVQQHAQAVKVLSRVSLSRQGTRDRGVLDYLEVLAGLIDDYERAARLKFDTSRSTPASVVRHLMSEGGCTISGLAREITISQSNLSEMLSGQREFSKRAISALSHRFGISPAIFF